MGFGPKTKSPYQKPRTLGELERSTGDTFPNIPATYFKELNVCLQSCRSVQSARVGVCMCGVCVCVCVVCVYVWCVCMCGVCVCVCGMCVCVVCVWCVSVCGCDVYVCLCMMCVVCVFVCVCVFVSGL